MFETTNQFIVDCLLLEVYNNKRWLMTIHLFISDQSIIHCLYLDEPFHDSLIWKVRLYWEKSRCINHYSRVRSQRGPCNLPRLLDVDLYMGMDQYLLIPFLMGWTSIYQLFWCSPGVQGFDTLPYSDILEDFDLGKSFWGNQDSFPHGQTSDTP